jgi:hypothetical protein
MVALGLGLYLPYVAVHTTLFERLVALTRERANIGYLLSLADAVGYLGYVVLMLAHGAVLNGESFLDFFVALAWVIAGFGAVTSSWNQRDSQRAMPIEPRGEGRDAGRRVGSLVARTHLDIASIVVSAMAKERVIPEPPTPVMTSIPSSGCARRTPLPSLRIA